MAKRIPSHKVEEIYNASDVLEIISDFVPLKKRGSTYFGLSPFSNEKTPSFAVSPTKNIWKDFSTGKGGNGVTFLMESEGMSYVEALKYIAEKYNIDLEMEETPEDYIRQDKRDSLYILNEFAAKFFNQQLTIGEGRQVGYSYFKERGILKSTMETFQLGYSPTSWDAFSQEALRNQYNEDFLIETGLAFKSDRDGKLLDRFRGRIMFPIHNHMGKVVGFGGRILDGKKKMAKYINSPESEIYQKSYILYGLHQGKKAIRDLDRTLLVEGYMDVIALYQAGIENVVATSGTALTVEQIRLVKRFTHNILLIYDADPAGISATLRGIDLLLEQEMNVRVLLLPEGEDPDSFVKTHGKSGFDAYSEEKAQDFIDFKIDCLAMSLDWSDPDQFTTAIHDTAATIAWIPDPVKRAIYMNRVTKRFGIKENTMQQSLNRALAEQAKLQERELRRQKSVQTRLSQTALPVTPATKVPETTRSVAVPVTSASTIPGQEREIIRLALNHYDKEINLEGELYPLIEVLLADIGEYTFESPKMEKFRQAVFGYYKENGKIDLNYFLSHPDPEIAQAASRMVEIPEEVSKNWEIKADIRAPMMDQNLEESVFSATMHFKLRKLEALINENMELQKNSPPGPGSDKLLKVYMRLKKMYRALTDEMGIIIPK